MGHYFLDTQYIHIMFYVNPCNSILIMLLANENNVKKNENIFAAVNALLNNKLCILIMVSPVGSPMSCVLLYRFP